ncbi:MAG: VCBS repeat-containing protein [Elusimicrobia bacterium]|nr:VCBS repeat-containing protein [Elusimicrobiota bacterium]
MHGTSLFLILACSAFAQNQPAPSGYVVRAEAANVYLDYGQASGVQTGQPFVIYKEGAELIHPVTKASLGRIETTLAEGTIWEVHPSYSIGALKAKPSGVIPAGARVRLLAPAPAAASTPPVPVPPSPAAQSAAGAAAPLRAPLSDAAKAEKTAVEAKAQEEDESTQDGETVGKPKNRRARWKSGVFDYQIMGIAVADFNGDGSPELAAAEETAIHLYAYPPTDAKSKADYKYPGIQPAIMSLEAADLNKNGRPELFVTVYNQGLARMETAVLELDAGGGWTKIGETPLVVRSYQGAKGERILAAQQLIDNQTFPFGSIYPLAYRDGKYVRGEEAVRYKRIDWIYDFTTMDPDGSGPVPLYYTATDRIRVDLKKGSWKSPEPYGQTPNRLRWKGDRLLQCRPELLLDYGEKGEPALYAVRNIARFGGLAHTFGLYARAEIHRKTWNGLGFDTTWKSDLTGFSPAIAWVPAGQGARELAVAVVGTTGKSALWIYDP